MNSLKVGDILYRSKLLVQHAGVVVGENAVLHIAPSGMEICTLAKYGEGKLVKAISCSLPESEWGPFLKRAYELVNEAKNYQLFSFNCEHLVSSIKSLKPNSSQITGAAMGAIAFGLFNIAKGNEKIFLPMGLGAFAGILLTNSMRKYDYTIQS